MKDDPRDVLGDDLWDLLGRADPIEVPATLDRELADRIAEAEGREALGDDLWDLLGQASEVAVPAGRPPAPPPIPWRGLVGALMAAALPFVIVPRIRREAPRDEGDLPLVRDLDLAESLDLVDDPDFDLLVRWDGKAP